MRPHEQLDTPAAGDASRSARYRAPVVPFRPRRTPVTQDESSRSRLTVGTRRPIALVDREGLLCHLRALDTPPPAGVSWNRERISLSDALARAERLAAGRRAAVQDDVVMVARA
jgi:hypothetical protein